MNQMSTRFHKFVENSACYFLCFTLKLSGGNGVDWLTGCVDVSKEFAGGRIVNFFARGALRKMGALQMSRGAQLDLEISSAWRCRKTLNTNKIW